MASQAQTDVGVTVRHATAGDVQAIAPLFDAYRQFYAASADVAASHDFLAARHARSESTLLIAVPPDVDDPVGFAHLYPSFSSVSLRPIVILNDLYVAPAWRRAKVARQLIAAAMTHSEQLGAIRLELATQLSNAPARRLYASLGFVPDAEFSHLSYKLV